MQVVVDWFQTNLGFLPPQLLVTLVSMLPLIELRGGIPLARLLMLPLWQALLFSAIGNILPIPFILFFIEKIFDWLRPTKTFGGIVEKLEKRSLSGSRCREQADGRELSLRRFSRSTGRRPLWPFCSALHLRRRSCLSFPTACSRCDKDCRGALTRMG